MGNSILPQNLNLDSMQNRWASILSPWLGNPLSKGIFLKNVLLATGDNVLNHLLQRNQQGFIITDINEAAVIYRSAPFNGLTLTLNSNVPVTVTIYVY